MLIRDVAEELKPGAADPTRALIKTLNRTTKSRAGRAEWWAGISAAAQWATHGAAVDWQAGPLLAAFLVVISSWAINAAWAGR